MKAKRTRRDKEFKFKVAIEAIKGDKQIAELAAEYNIHPNQISTWKKELLEKGPGVFASSVEADAKRIERERDELYKTIGHQQVRVDWLKKKLGISHVPIDED
jgi:putative transposase